ncbi:hypothetical protein FB45DRAFT_204154 [Roridomyces roridus]|uniref:Uncharacterized protein n=1 Tax=Roridomyces roridus TaxID=1738132 RepID=A0AAD7CHW0_9AGAR|nr:hypothetical protein FB45DRAFT_204154 [Roridomyces roridus]
MERRLDRVYKSRPTHNPSFLVTTSCSPRGGTSPTLSISPFTHILYSDCTSQEKMKLHQPPTPACAPITLNLPPKHPGTTGARGPSSSTSDVVDHLKASPRHFFDRNPAASKCSPLVWRSRLLEKASRLQEGCMGSVVTDVSRSTLLLQVAPRLAARMAASLAGAVDVDLDRVGLGW